MESELDMKAAAGEADSARNERRRLAVTRPAESQVVDAVRLRFNLIMIVSRQVSTKRRQPGKRERDNLGDGQGERRQ